MVLSSSLAALLLGAAVPLVSATKNCAKRTSSKTDSEKVAGSYFAAFHEDEGAPLSSIQWPKYTDIKWAFAQPMADGSLDMSKAAPDKLPDFVAEGKKFGVKTLLSIGGWSGSGFFSSNFGSPENRTAFVKTCLDVVKKYDLGGLDMDWEYPNTKALSCNTASVNDTANFLSFLEELRQQAPNLTLTAAASLFPWKDSSGERAKDLSGFANVLDYLTIMNYDVFGAWAPNAGPNAPLDSTCDPRNNQGSAKTGVEAWMAAGVPANKIVLGLPAYGHAFRVNKTSALNSNGDLQLYPPQNGSDRVRGTPWDNDPEVDGCGDPQPASGTYPLFSLIKNAGFLNESAQPLPGIKYVFDECSQTPFVWNATSEVFVSYDDAKSITAKGEFIKETGLRGFVLYEAGGDYNNILVDAARKSTGISK